MLDNRNGPFVSLDPAAPLQPSRLAALGLPFETIVWFWMIEYAVFSPASAYWRAVRSAELSCAERALELVKLIIDATKMMRTTVMPKAITSAIPSSCRRRSLMAPLGRCSRRSWRSVSSCARRASP